MATQAHCAYCFEALAASFENRQPLALEQVQELWDRYANNVEANESTSARPAAVSRVLNHGTSNNSSSSTLTSTSSSSQNTTNTTPATSVSSSRSSLPSPSSILTPDQKCPLFITWNTISPKSGSKTLRGCIGTFSPQPLEDGLQSYALTSAFDDHRFSPVPASLLPRLQCCVTLLTNFSTPTTDPMDWTIGTHGIRISFTYHGRKLGATYLPDVALEQGWTKEEAIVSLMQKAGWSGQKNEWRKVQGFELVRYEGKKVDLNYGDWKQWRDWVAKQGVQVEALN